MSSSIQQLRAVVANETLSLAERRTAAQLLVNEIVDAVPEPTEDDADVLALMTPPRSDTSVGQLLPRAWAIRNESRRWAASGPTPAQARRHVYEQRRTGLLHAIYRDKSLHGLEREAAQRLVAEAK